MLLDQLRSKEGLTHQEALVADYIISELAEISHLSASDLARKSYTSKATVVRLSQKLGCSGYQELKMKLAIEGHQKQHFEQLLQDEPITSASRFQDLIETIPGLYDKAITNTNLTLSKQNINRIATYLNQADQIELYGTGISYHLAQAAAFKFQTLGRQTQAFESLSSHYIASRPSAKRVALLLTFTGKNQQILEIAKFLRKHTDTYLVGIAGPYQEELEQYCHIMIEIHNRDSLTSLDVVSSFVSCNYILDLLFALLLTKQYDRQIETNLTLLENKDDES